MFNYLKNSNHNSQARPRQDPASSAAGAGRRPGVSNDATDRTCSESVLQQQRLQHTTVGGSKTSMPVMTSQACDQTWVAGPTTSITESLVVLARLQARVNQSAASSGNGRGASSVDRPLRLTTAPRERAGCSPASLPPEGTSWPSSRCIGPDEPPVGGVQQLRLPWFACYIRV